MYPATILIAALAVALIVLFAEWLHASRIMRVARLAFGAAGQPAWTKALAPARVVGSGLVVWSLLTLLSIDGAAGELKKSALPDRHLILALDVSPSMYLADSGAEGKNPRRERAAEVMESILDRLDLSRTKVSVVAFYSTAKPVVIDTFDLNVVKNVIRGLPLEQAFKAGQTDMYSGVREAIKIAERWEPGSTTLVVLSDGDTLPEQLLPALPPSIGDALVIGIGNPFRGSDIAGRSSRQDAPSLKHLAARLRGEYHDGNALHLPTAVLRSLNMVTLRRSETPALRTLALIALALGATLLALISPALAFFADRRPRVGATQTFPNLATSRPMNPPGFAGT
ncbi:MAG: vWA domain-containing protein [Phycisphaerales bacterium]